MARLADSGLTGDKTRPPARSAVVVGPAAPSPRAAKTAVPARPGLAGSTVTPTSVVCRHDRPEALERVRRTRRVPVFPADEAKLGAQEEWPRLPARQSIPPRT